MSPYLKSIRVTALLILLSIPAGLTTTRANEVLDPEFDNMLRPQPSCGVACVAAMLALRGDDVSLSDVERTFLSRGVQHVRSPVSAADIKRVLADNGYLVEVVKFRDAFPLLALPVPAIAHCDRGSAFAGEVSEGHFVTIVRVDSDAVWLMDLTRQPALFRETVGDFRAIWRNVAIISTESDRHLRRVGTSLIVVLGLVTAGVLWRVFRWKRPCDIAVDRAVLLCISIASISIPGCQRNGDMDVTPTSPLLNFEKPSHHLGAVAPDQLITERFQFQVVGRDAVQIREVQTCCGCKLADDSIIGRDLAPGQDYELSINTNTGNTLNSRSLFIKIVTDPPSTVIPVLGIHFRCRSQLNVSPQRITLETTKSQPDLPVVRAIQSRLPDDAVLKFRPADFRSADFDLGSINVHSEPVLQFGDRVIEEATLIPLRLKRPLSDSEPLRTIVVLPWSDGTRIEIPVEIRRVSPVRLEPQRVFLGVVAPAAELSASVRVHATELVNPNVESIRSNSEHCRASYDMRRQRLDIVVKSPDAPGQFAANLVITFSASDLPPITLPVIGVVRNNSDATRGHQ